MRSSLKENEFTSEDMLVELPVRLAISALHQARLMPSSLEWWRFSHTWSRH